MVVERAKAARASQDWGSYVNCMTPHSQFGYMSKCVTNVAAALNDRGGEFRKDPQRVADLAQIIAAHGITADELKKLGSMPRRTPQDEQEYNRVFLPLITKVRDPRGLVIALVTRLPPSPAVKSFETVKNVELREDKAIVTLTMQQGTGPAGFARDYNVTLRKTEHGWRIPSPFAAEKHLHEFRLGDF